MPSPDDDNTGSNVTMLVLSGPHQGQRFVFHQRDTLVAGRSKDTQLNLPDDPGVSRYHCRLEVRPPECYLADLDSRNGTWVNDQRVNQCFLNHQDVVSLGQTKLRVEIRQSSSGAVQAIPATTHVSADPPGQFSGVNGTRDSADAEDTWQPVPGYTLVEKLGEGAMGAVYRAVQKSSSRRVAVKVIVPERADCEKNIQLFLREASVLSHLNHPRIVRFHELGVAAGQFYFVMEEVTPVDFDAILSRETAESRIRICCGIARQILDALGYAHSLSIVHRDIKPANVLVTRPQRKLKCKVADFGLAKNFSNAGFSEITRDGEARGTVAFMPPEQLIECRQAKPAADIYAVGATLYYYLARKFPFEFSEGRSVFSQVLEHELIPLGQRCPDVPTELAAVIHKAMARDPADRFASAEEMGEALLPFSKRRR